MAHLWTDTPRHPALPKGRCSCPACQENRTGAEAHRDQLRREAHGFDALGLVELGDPEPPEWMYACGLIAASLVGFCLAMLLVSQAGHVLRAWGWIN